jgi:dipeptidase
VKAFYAISNGLSIGEEFDMSHPELLATARKKGWLKKGETFHFAKCFSDWFYTTFSASRHRQGRCRSLLAQNKGGMDLFSATGILRDHQEHPYFPHKHLLGTRLCAHAANGLTRNATQSTGSLIAHLKPDIQTYWATGTSAPCTGIFKPIRFHGDTLPDVGPSPGARFNPDNLWWHHERLHRSVLLDFSTRLETFRPERDLLENSFIKKALDHRPYGPWVLTQQAFQQAREATEKWTRQVQERPLQNRAGWLYRHYWDRQNKKAQIVVC